MAKNARIPLRAAPALDASGISGIGAEGFKSIRKRTEIAIRPLTILAGANSSGKSSILQPALLMKQTLEAPYDPGALLLDGPHVRFTAASQLFSRFGGKSSNTFLATIRTVQGRTAMVHFKKQPKGGLDVEWVGGNGSLPSLSVDLVRNQLSAIIHVPALRGNPERTYKTTAVGDKFAGTFEPYVASIIHHWQATKDIRRKQLGVALQKLELNWHIQASRVDDTRVELSVARLKQKTAGGERDLVSIADVGFGISQCLPVLVALLTAKPGQLVYIEEPEIHLHPRAQVALAQILADVANRGVRVVIETHSSLLLLGVQALVAEGALSPDLVALHWFSLTKDGATQVRSADLDETGAFGEWPEDFAEVTLDAQSRYLDAAEKRLARAKR